MTAPKESAIQRLAKLLRRPAQCPEQRALQAHHRWIAKVGGVFALDGFLEARERQGLDQRLSEQEQLWMKRLEPTLRTAFLQVCELQRKPPRPDPPSWEERQRLINQREAERRKAADIYSHVPKPNLKAMEKQVSTHERMAAAYRKLINDILRDIRQAKGAP